LEFSEIFYRNKDNIFFIIEGKNSVEIFIIGGENGFFFTNPELDSGFVKKMKKDCML